MIDTSKDTDKTSQVGLNTTTTNAHSSQSVLLKRNPHLRETSQTSSPAGFGGLGTRQFVRKQLITPGSATSASSFEEGASYDGFSDAGTPASDGGYMAKSTGKKNMTRLAKQPTKKLSSPSRKSLMRRLVDDEEVETHVDRREDDFLPCAILHNIVVKRVPSIYAENEVEDYSTSMTSVSSPSRQIVVPQNMRRVMVRSTGADGQIHEQVQYVDADGQVVRQGDNLYNAEDETDEMSTISSGRATVTGWVSAPAKTLRRIAVRKTGADGQVHEEVQFVDVDGNVVDREGVDSNVKTKFMTTTPTIVRRIVNPGKLTRRILRRTGPDGQVHVQVQYVDVDGNIVRTEDGDFGSISHAVGDAVTRRTVTPSKTTRRVVVRKTGADGQLHQTVQCMDPDGNIVQSDGTALITTSGPRSGHTMTQHIVSPGNTLKQNIGNTLLTVGGDDTSVVVEQNIDWDGQMIVNEGHALSSAGSFSGSVSSVTSDTSTTTSRRRIVTRRVVASPNTVPVSVVVHKVGSSSDAECEEVQYVESEDDESSTSRGFTRVVTSQNSPGQRVITRRIVTPQRVVRRMVVRKGIASSDTEAVDGFDIDADIVQSEGNASSDESVGGSSRDGYSVSDRIVIPRRTRRVVSCKTSSSDNSKTKVDDAADVTDAMIEKLETTENLTDEEDNSTISSRDVIARAVSAVKSADVSNTQVDDGNQELPKARAVATVAGAAVKVSVIDGDSSRHHDEIKSTEKTSSVGELCRTVTKDIANSKMVPPSISAPSEEASQGGFLWDFFKSEKKPKKDSDNEESVNLVSMQTEEGDTMIDYIKGAAPTTKVSIVDTPMSPVRTSFAIRETRHALPPHEKDDEKPTAFYEMNSLDEDKPRVSASVKVLEPQAATKLSASPASPHDNNLVQTPARTDATVVKSIVAIDAHDHKEPKTYASSHLAKTEIAATLGGPHAAVAIEEDVSDMSNHKAGRSIWKFWGSQKYRSSLSEDDKLHDGDKHPFKESVAAVTTNIGLPAIRDQGNVTESRRADLAEPAHATNEGFESGFLYLNTAAVPAFDNAAAIDVIAVPNHEEREKYEHEELTKAESERAGGLQTVISSVSSGHKVDWAIEEEDAKNSPKPSTHHDKIVAVAQVDPIRDCMQSDNTLTNSAGPVSSSGKTIRDNEPRVAELIDSSEPDIELDEQYVQIASPRRSHALDGEELWTFKPCTLAWSSLCLNRKSWNTSSANDEVVLDDVSGIVNPGEFLVITGPSRDESNALLSCLAGIEDAVKGNVTVNGRTWNEKMNRYIGYVMHEDLFYETLTMEEHLIAQAYLRMHRTHTDEMCLEQVEHVIEEIGLSGCRDKLIGGGVSLRGITHGERKLLALATALLTNPSILLVEDPIDDLDTVSAERIVSKLRWLALEKGLTVAVTIHHVSSHLYGLFDVLYLVADASCVYEGKADDCVSYFSTIAYQCPEYMSPIDYFMLQMVVGDRESDDEGVARVDTLKHEWAQRHAARYAENAARAATMSEDVVVDEYDQKNRYYHMGCCGQLWFLWARHIRRLSRYGFVFQWHLLAALLIGVVFGLVYLQIDLNDQHGIQNLSGAFFYVLVVQMIFVAYRTFVFMPRETAIALRERQENHGGWYNLLCWYLTKIVAELPALILLSIVLFVPVYLLVGIGHNFKVYVYMQIVMVLAGWTAVGLAFATLGVLRHVTLALIVYTILLVLFGVFGGLLMNVADIPDWFMWLHYISPIKYSYESMMKIFWKRVKHIDCDPTLEACVAFTGDGVLEYYSMEKRSALGDTLILLAIGLSLFVVAFWFLVALANKRINGLQWRYDWDFKGPLGHHHQRVASSTINERKAATKGSTHHIMEQKNRHSLSAAVASSSPVVEMENHYIRVETPRIGGHGICDAPRVTLGWSSLWLDAPIDKKPKSDGEAPHLLCDASGSAKSGELVLITGPSDDSNVALLKSLGGLQKTMKGKVTLNGVWSAANKLSKYAAYVARDDLFYDTLTVEEHLRFQAQLVAGKSNDGFGLCCGAGFGDLEAERVELVLDELDLTTKRCVLIRYLSEADTKLLAVATALLVNPSILLAEEPTRGMDFYASRRVVLKLSQLARGRTVVVTMSHPSSHLYALFDTLYLLAGGAAVYHGKVREAVSYFSSLGYQCPQYMNPVDYFVRQLSVKKQDEETGDSHATLFKEVWATRCSEWCLDDNIDESEPQVGEVSSRFRVGCCLELSLLFRRHILCLARYRAGFGWHSFGMIVASVIFGLFFLQLDLDDQQDIQNWAGAFFFMVMLQVLVMAYRTFVFLPREMAIVEREHHSGDYYLVSWYLTKVVTELPAMLILSVLLFVPAYLLIGIGHGFQLYFYMQLVMWLVSWSSMGLVSLLLGLVRRVRVALIVYLLLVILFVVFGGLLINGDDVPKYLIWLHYISPVKYGYEALMKLFWSRIGVLACGASDGSGSGDLTSTILDDKSYSMSGSEDEVGCIARSGDEVLTHFSMDMARGPRNDSLILLVITLLSFFVGYAVLSLRWHRYKHA